MKKIELLAPAKDFNCGKLAIDCGADAVYIGSTSFGARASAHNNIEDIQRLTDYAHEYRAKVYVTVNTLLDDDEIIKAEKLINSLYDIGVDAVIIQDLGLLECDLPPIYLHASTQMHNMTPEKVKFLEKVGLQRVILARELSLENIKEIKKHTNIELEYFVHGALCVSYSGQCYMSYAIGGRSGNKGVCAQPCRKKYSLVDSSNKIIAKDSHLLSLKDLNLSERLESMIDAGISSFKIEGRLKDESYVKNVVSYYNRKLNDSLALRGLQRSSLGASKADFIPELGKTFNRGYTTYNLSGKRDNITAFNSPKFVGEYLGGVKEIKKDSFKLDNNIPLSSGDGLSFYDQSGKLSGSVVNKYENGFIYLDKMHSIVKEAKIYRNHDKVFIKQLKNACVKREIPIAITVEFEKNRIIFKAVDLEGITAEIELTGSFEQANDSVKILEMYKKQLAKLGDTGCKVEKISFNSENCYFMKVKDINEVRRNLISKLQLQRKQLYKIQSFDIIPNNYPYPEKELYFNGNVLNEKAKYFYCRHGVKVLEMAAESGIDMQGKVIMTTKHCLRHEFDLCQKQTGDLFLVDEYNKKYKLEFDCKNCEMKVIY